MGLDPDLAAAIAAFEGSGLAPLTGPTAPEARTRYRRVGELRRGADYVPEAVARVGDTTCEGPLGPIALRVYEPEPRIAATVVYLHGGGWVIGDLESADPVCRTLANRTGARVVSVDYRLAPEFPHPGPIDDSMAALRWAAERWPDERFGVAGDSAGGGLAAGCALRARDESLALAGQLLLYPGVDPTMSRPSVRANGEGYFLTRADMEWFEDRYLPEPWMRADPVVNPFEADSLAGLAPAVVAVAEFDPLRDEGVDYAGRLRDAGVPVTLIPGPGLIHGYFPMVGISAAAARIADEVRAAFTTLLS